jgi:hypothetical protein
MTTELVLLLTIFAFVVMGVFLGDMGPLETFRNSGPRLGARIERNMAIGRSFVARDGRSARWQAP